MNIPLHRIALLLAFAALLGRAGCALATSSTPHSFLPVELMPHQVAVSDLVCTGRVLSTNDGRTVDFAIDDLVWGSPPSTNVTLEEVHRRWPLETLRPGHKYLVFAFTNDWWGTGWQAPNIGFNRLLDYITPTSRPPGGAVFDGYRIMSEKESVIDFDWLDYGGTNYWEATRAFITNFNEVARVRHDPAAAKNLVYDTLTNRESRAALPLVVLSKLRRYSYFYYESDFVKYIKDHKRKAESELNR